MITNIHHQHHAILTYRTDYVGVYQNEKTAEKSWSNKMYQ